MSEKDVVTPFEIGVLAALQLIGKAIAMNPHLDVDALKNDAERLMSSMPSEPKWEGSASGIHQHPIESLLRGIEKVQR